MIRKKKGYFILIVVLGLAFVLSNFLVRYLTGEESRYLEFLSGFGSALIGVGLVQIFLITMKPEIIRRQEISQKDERSIKLREKSAHTTFFITLFAMLIVEIIFLFMNALIPCLIVIGLMTVHLLSFLGFTFYYNQKI